jgi:hypothetical protein
MSRSIAAACSFEQWGRASDPYGMTAVASDRPDQVKAAAFIAERFDTGNGTDGPSKDHGTCHRRDHDGGCLFGIRDDGNI